MEVARSNGRIDLLGRCIVDMLVADLQYRRGVAAAHAGRAQHADLGGVHAAFQRRDQLLASGQFARKRLADADRQVRWRCLAFAHRVEMGVKGRHFPDLGHRHAHFFRQRPQMRGGKVAVCILNEMQELDQQVAAARTVAQKRAHLVPSAIFQLSALGRVAPLALAGFPDSGFVIERHDHSPSASPARVIAGRLYPFNSAISSLDRESLSKKRIYHRDYLSWIACGP